jgi:uncharacterized protein YndB with AHSA1/START domain
MSIAPVVKTVRVSLPPERAFTAFVEGISQWWQKGKTIGAEPHVAIVIEPRAGGRWFERDAQGTECDWGQVLAWEPPHRLLLGWQLDAKFRYDPAILTEVELSFSPTGSGTSVTLEHRNLERFGADAPKVRESIGEGWPFHLDAYAAYANDKEIAQ